MGGGGGNLVFEGVESGRLEEAQSVQEKGAVATGSANLKLYTYNRGNQ